MTEEKKQTKTEETENRKIEKASVYSVVKFKRVKNMEKDFIY